MQSDFNPILTLQEDSNNDLTVEDCEDSQETANEIPPLNINEIPVIRVTCETENQSVELDSEVNHDQGESAECEVYLHDCNCGASDQLDNDVDVNIDRSDILNNAHSDVVNASSGHHGNLVPIDNSDNGDSDYEDSERNELDARSIEINDGSDISFSDITSREVVHILVGGEPSDNNLELSTNDDAVSNEISEGSHRGEPPDYASIASISDARNHEIVINHSNDNISGENNATNYDCGDTEYIERLRVNLRTHSGEVPIETTLNIAGNAENNVTTTSTPTDSGASNSSNGGILENNEGSMDQELASFSHRDVTSILQENALHLTASFPYSENDEVNGGRAYFREHSTPENERVRPLSSRRNSERPYITSVPHSNSRFNLPPPSWLSYLDNSHFPPRGPDCNPGCGYTGLPCYVCSTKPVTLYEHRFRSNNIWTVQNNSDSLLNLPPIAEVNSANTSNKCDNCVVACWKAIKKYCMIGLTTRKIFIILVVLSLVYLLRFIANFTY